MLIAREKKKSNIAEYILYMWQVEDMLRGLGMDIQRVKREIVDRFQTDEATAKQMTDWYDNLIAMMQKEKTVESGHLQVLRNEVDQLTELHFFLLHEEHDPRYGQIVSDAMMNLVEFRQKAGVGNNVSDVELALNGLYGQLMLRLQKKTVSKETEAAMSTFGKMIGYLAAKHKEEELGNRDL